MPLICFGRADGTEVPVYESARGLSAGCVFPDYYRGISGLNEIRIHWFPRAALKHPRSVCTRLGRHPGHLGQDVGCLFFRRNLPPRVPVADFDYKKVGTRCSNPALLCESAHDGYGNSSPPFFQADVSFTFHVGIAPIGR
jgi:hypothetical protein